MTATDWLSVGLLCSSVTVMLLIVEQNRQRLRMKKLYQIMELAAQIDTALTTAVFKNSADIKNMKGNHNA